MADDRLTPPFVRGHDHALDTEVAFVAELIEHRPGYARTIASAYEPGMALREGHEFALAGTPCEHAYETDLLLVRRAGGSRDSRHSRGR